MQRKKSAMPNLKVKISLISTLNGKIIAIYDEPSHTFVRNWFNILFSAFTSFTSTGSTYGEGYLSSKGTGGSISNTGFGYSNTLLGTVSAAGRGIVVGRGTSAEDFERNTLVTPITEGTSVNQLHFQAQSATTAAYTLGTKTWAATLKRIMNNNSAAAIDITETGICLYNTGIGDFLIQRDLLGAAVPVAAGGQLTVTYIFSLTFPA